MRWFLHFFSPKSHRPGTPRSGTHLPTVISVAFLIGKCLGCMSHPTQGARAAFCLGLTRSLQRCSHCISPQLPHRGSLPALTTFIECDTSVGASSLLLSTVYRAVAIFGVQCGDNSPIMLKTRVITSKNTWISALRLAYEVWRRLPTCLFSANPVLASSTRPCWARLKSLALFLTSINVECRPGVPCDEPQSGKSGPEREKNKRAP